jgi:large subunit ribosomal protein L29
VKGLKPSDLREKTLEELTEELAREREALFSVRRQIIFAQVKDVMSVRVHRKNVARIMTEMAVKDREAAK